MNDKQIFAKVKACILKTLDIKASDIKLKSRIIDDLGADSLDLLDLFFRLEQAFAIKLSPREIEKQISEKLKDSAFGKDGFVTEPAKKELQKLMPEVPAEKFRKALHQNDLPGLLTVEVIVNLVKRKSGVKHAAKK
jgi:acyl carrier protein